MTNEELRAKLPSRFAKYPLCVIVEAACSNEPQWDGNDGGVLVEIRVRF